MPDVTVVVKLGEATGKWMMSGVAAFGFAPMEHLETAPILPS